MRDVPSDSRECISTESRRCDARSIILLTRTCNVPTLFGNSAAGAAKWTDKLELDQKRYRQQIRGQLQHLRLFAEEIVER